MINIDPNSRGNRFRRARIERLKSLIDSTLSDSDSCSILDIGGTYGFWNTWEEDINQNQVSVTCVNLNPSHYDADKKNSFVTMIRGNACDLSHIGDEEYDIVFSNSVIEHVGSWANMQAMAREVDRVAPRYIVQTPNFWFPIEPHARTPMLHWVPEQIAYRIVMKRKCGFWNKQDNVSDAVSIIQSAKLIDFKQLQVLFPSAKIEKEKFFLFTKSLLAVKE